MRRRASRTTSLTDAYIPEPTLALTISSSEGGRLTFMPMCGSSKTTIEIDQGMPMIDIAMPGAHARGK